ncbi:SigE family RNA polymerase sigma factor [Frankia sp. AgB32]|uniref:SigE family RNA polymerase sigma factor n=1 Tax=Frankia sp. AgB32 TaxID=631119 RepID=UPI00200C3F79|nr:SigE family RNA polymerase sigma factor [Frankia sp. AgB32]MCK9897192.1 SigE family RNA polymerase sigma factor [Frankia sp. AgB32]
MDFPHALRERRTRRQLSQLDLALRAGTTQRHLSFIESGRSPAPASASASDPYTAVGQLFGDYRPDLLRIAVVLLGDQRTAEDVVQEAFIGLMRHWSRLRDPDSAVAYVRSAVLNGARGVLRRRAVLARLGVRHEPPIWSAGSAAMFREDRREVMAALRRLPPRRQQVLVLRYYLDLSGNEIAEMLGITSATVRSTAARALRTLARQLGEEAR